MDSGVASKDVFILVNLKNSIPIKGFSVRQHDLTLDGRAESVDTGSAGGAVLSCSRDLVGMSECVHNVLPILAGRDNKVDIPQCCGGNPAQQ